MTLLQSHYGESTEAEIPMNLGQELSGILASIAESYVFHPLSDSNFVTQNLYKGSLQCDPSLYCVVREMGNVRNETDATEQIGFKMTLMKFAGSESAGELVCEAALLHMDPIHWEFSHRLVPKKYQRKGYFRVVQEALEAFIQRRSDITQEMLRIYLTAGQLQVILAFEKNGYEPQSPNDAENIQRMKYPDDGLLFDYTYRQRTDEQGGITFEPNLGRGLYCFEKCLVGDGKDKSMLISTNAFRCGLQKKLFPRTDAVEGVLAETTVQMQSLL